jgi:uncharacterized protein (TIGR02594 family)
MVVSSAFRRALVVLALLSAAVAASASPASARSRHGAYRHAHAHYALHHMRRHFAARQSLQQPGYQGFSWQGASFSPSAEPTRRIAYRSRGHIRQQAALARLRHYAHSQTTATPQGSGAGAATSGSSSSLVMEARQFLGTKPSGMGSLWCARFMNMVLEKTGHKGTGSAMANSFASYGTRISGPQVGAIAVMGRRGGGHVGIITGIDSSGNPIMISGNNGNRVREAPVSRGRIYAYVMPN